MTIPASPTGPTAPTAGWNTVMSDDFTGTSLNSSLWFAGAIPTGQSLTTNPYTCGFNHTGTPPTPAGNIQVYNSSLVTVSGSICTLTLQAVPGSGTITAGPTSGGVSTVYSYESGCIQSGPNSAPGQTGFTYQPSTRTVVEFYAKPPEGSTGLWPALWSSSVGTWTYELDLYEGYGTNASTQIQTTQHYVVPPATSCNAQDGAHIATVSDMSTAFHRYTMDVNSDGNGKVDYYFDGTLMVSYTTAGYQTANMAIIANLAYNATGGTLPATLQIDSIAVYQPASTTTPVFNADTPPSGTVGVPYSYTFTASGDPAPTFTASSLPPGLTFSGATLSGTPTTIGTTTLTVTATNGSGSVTIHPVIAVSAYNVPTTTYTPAEWTNVFWDDFTGGSLNTNVWFPGALYNGSVNTAGFNNTGTGGSPAGEYQLYIPGNVSVANSICSLTLKSQTITGDPNSTNYSYTSGCISTRPNTPTSSNPGFTFPATTRTFYQASIKVPEGFTGSWPTFGARATNTLNWEVDVFSMLGNSTTPEQNVQYVSSTSYTTDNTQAGPNVPTPFADLSTSFHIYAVDMNVDGKGTCNFYIDDVFVCSLTGAPQSTSEMELFFALALNNASPPGASLPAVMEIDWVAVYQYTPVPPPVTYAPVFTTDTPPSGAVGTAYYYLVTATGGPAPSFSATGLPAGLTMNTSGVISGTPTTAGSNSVTITATNTSGTITHTTTIVIAATPVIPTFTADTPPGGTIGVAYSYTFTASGTPTPTISGSGSIPGLTWSGGTLSGTPTTAGTTSLSVTATNTAGSVNATPSVTIASVSASIANVPSNPSTLLLQQNQIWGTNYLPNPTITMMGQTTSTGGGGSAVAIGGTSWQVIDINGNVVGSGTMSNTATTITVANGTSSWVGGSTIIPGWYTISCSNGATGAVAVCISTSNLWRPPYNYNTQNFQSFSAWLGSAADRDLYQIPQVGYTLTTTGAQAGALLVTSITNDAYFGAGGAPLDSARPRKIWVSSSAQPNSPTQDPTPAFWGAVATYMAANGYPGIIYDGPTNEPENGGFTISEIISYWQSCYSSIIAADSTAKVWGFTSAGIGSGSPVSALASFLSSCGADLSGLSNHMEAGNQNDGDHILLRQYYSLIKTQLATSGYTNLDYRNTETGINEGQFGCMHPRRGARQRTMLRLISEQYGWSSQNNYDFEVFDHTGSGYNLFFYMMDVCGANHNGNMRAGAYAIHVFNDALWGTTCTPTNPPTKLSFGTTGSVGDALFVGSHYSNGTANDVVVLGTAGIPSATVTLNVSCTGTITYWDGMGVPYTTTVSGGKITVPVNDLLTYVFLPASTTVSVYDTDQGAVSFSSATNLALTAASVKNEANTTVTTVTDGNWAKNYSGTGDDPGITVPYTDTTFPASITITLSSAQTIAGFAFKGPAPAWEGNGCGYISCNVTIDGTQVWSFNDPTAVSYGVPTPSTYYSSDACTRITFWQSPYGFIYKLPTPITGTVIKLTVTAVGYGGQPDTASSVNTAAHVSPQTVYDENDPMKLMLSQFAVFS